MPLDPDRAAFLMAPYRWSEAQNATVLADHPNARQIELATGIATVAGGAALASEILSLLQTPAIAYEIEIEGVEDVLAAAWDGSAPAYRVHAPDLGDDGTATRLLAAVTIDLDAGTARLTVRG